MLSFRQGSDPAGPALGKGLRKTARRAQRSPDQTGKAGAYLPHVYVLIAFSWMTAHVPLSSCSLTHQLLLWHWLATGSPHGYGHMVGCRYDSSLGQLTKKFISLINKASDGILDLNHAADMLQVGPKLLCAHVVQHVLHQSSDLTE